MRNLMDRTNLRTEDNQIVYTDGNDYFTCDIIKRKLMIDGEMIPRPYYDYKKVTPTTNLVRYPRSLKK